MAFDTTPFSRGRDDVYQLTDDEIVPHPFSEEARVKRMVEDARAFLSDKLDPESTMFAQAARERAAEREIVPEPQKLTVEMVNAARDYMQAAVAADDAHRDLAIAQLDWRVVQQARELCRSSGHDPDLMVLDIKCMQRGPLGSTLPGVTKPAWTLYLDMAQGIVGALCQQSSSSSQDLPPLA